MSRRVDGDVGQVPGVIAGCRRAAEGRFTFTLLRFTMLRLTSMKAARRKNMMSMSGNDLDSRFGVIGGKFGVQV
jgi:hypothetical protein